ncbi:hypothetical protein [Paucibacter sp. Y2R2-4]|uniref:hypothetical protein n=1 Tax=Paucibacter sp. Y2R2-4 TaxID=2893553 RepID=UPI0021E39D15|nr:hypothetical protein [Paucibacter sp. Y2R2-4]MCV2349310.1 hypothetical protein [Paucibacter sp. Y2R2-4]
MKERPMLFSAPMVRAILAGTKTQTRRVVPTMLTLGRLEFPGRRDRKGFNQVNWLDTVEGQSEAIRWCRYGQPGDRLWVREAFARIDGQTRPWIETDYRATYTHGDRLGDLLGEKKRWTPSIHMPRHASRITLEITGVRLERLQEISNDDAHAEGAADWAAEIVSNGNKFPSTQRAFQALWESINGAEAWALNPWVWVVEFKRLEQNGGAV